jgi:hypothetical protein
MFDDELVNRSHEAEVDTLKLAAALRSWFKHVRKGEEALSIKLLGCREIPLNLELSLESLISKP